MKKIFTILLAAMALAMSCTQNGAEKLATVRISIESEESELDKEGIAVTLRDLNGTTQYNAVSDASGIATFTVPNGVYEASASCYFEDFVYNGINSSINAVGGENDFKLNLKKSRISSIVLKEAYFGGILDNNGKNFTGDDYFILYNNSASVVDISNYSFAFCNPYNSGSTNKYLVDGKLIYENQGWLPAGCAVWWFTSKVEIQPYSQIVISLGGAIDHSQAFPNAVDLSNPDYYVMYDIESGFNNAAQYPSPSAGIPESHYLKTYRYAMGNAWVLSQLSPAIFISNQPGMEAYVKNPDNLDRTENAKIPNAKLLSDNVVDAVEVFATTSVDKNNKRLPASIDAGYVMFTSKNGYSIYRNVNKEATLAIEGNAEKLVYNYAGGTENVEGSTDPSGIDAEASIANGAKIVYMDTNNSTKDFHQRAKASLRK